MPPTISLANLIRDANIQLRREGGNAEECAILGVRDDSREVQPGDLFVARKGHESNGTEFIADAVSRGAVAVVVGPGIEVPNGPVVLRTEQPAFALNRLVLAYHGDPSTDLRLVGITGTNGKTTVATLLKQLFSACSRRSGLIGTVEIDDGVEITPAELTTPGAVEIGEILSRMRERDCQVVAMEVSSHALEQGRTEGLQFAAGIFTNLSGDHLDYHGSMDAYSAAKARLFTGLSKDAIAVVNGLDPASRVMLKESTARAIAVVVGDEDPIVEAPELLRVVPEVLDVDGMTLQVTSPWGSGECRVPLVGVHNAFNCAAVLATACAMGIEFDSALKGLELAKAPRGRLEPVHTPEDSVRVFVDYAHTDDAITNVLRALKAVIPPRGSLTVVFGAGGDRDRSKRPRMAEAACRGADLVMVTSDNPRTEDPEEIVQEILTGVPESDRSRVSAEVDRAVAIDRAIQSAQPGDVVVIAGKGHEDYQIIGTTKRHFDDVEIARRALMRRREGAPA